MYIQIIHGPNLNLLGKREPEHYGVQTLDDINGTLALRAQELEVKVDFFSLITKVTLSMLFSARRKMKLMES